jgi:hypothetical protein
MWEDEERDGRIRKMLQFVECEGRRRGQKKKKKKK